MIAYCVINIEFYFWVLFMIGEAIFLHVHTEISEITIITMSEI